MIVISEELKLANPSIGGVTPTLNNPIIGIDSVATIENTTVDEENALYPLENLFATATFWQWRAETTAVQYLTVDTDGDTIDYVGLANHNFAEAGISVSIEEDTGSGFVHLAGPILPGSNEPIVFRFTGGPRAGIRVKFEAGSAPPRLGVLNVGELVVLQRRIYVGHTPLPLGRVTEIETGNSESGHFLGRIVTNESLSSTITLNNVTPDWYRQVFDVKFAQLARERPFFWGWRPLSYPDEMGYAWVSGDIRPSNQRPNGMMQVEFTISGISFYVTSALGNLEGYNE
mgnify:CR=1 FL=1